MFPYRSYSLLGKYKNNYQNVNWAMDIRHIMILHNILISNPYRCVLEIGSHYGASTTAIIEALNCGCQFDVHLCDICFLPSVKELCNTYYISNKLSYHETVSRQFLQDAPKFDFAFLDGSHISEDVQDEFELLSMNNTQTYFLHDTWTQLLPESVETPWYDGPMLLRNKLTSSCDWMCLEDHIERQFELTNRGILFATRSISEYQRAKRVFDYWCSLSYSDLIQAAK